MAIAGACLVATCAHRARHAGNPAGAGRHVLQGRAARAAWLRRLATTAIRVRIPEGVIDVKPMPKPGWTLNIVKGKYAKTYSLFRAKSAKA